MGDEPPLRQNPRLRDNDEHLSRERPPQTPLPVPNPPSGQPANMEFEPYPRPQFAIGNFATTAPLDMSNLAAALPEYHIRQFQQPPYTQPYQHSASTNPSMMYQYHQGAQFAGQTAAHMNPSFSQQYPSQYGQGAPSRQQQQGANYPQFVGNPAGPGGPQPYPNQAFVVQQPIIHNPSAAAQSHHHPQFSQPHGTAAYVAPYSSRLAAGYPLPQLRLDNSLAQSQTPGIYPSSSKAVRRSSSNSSLQTSVLRGPPRKPKQSGHALWVGNLPPATHIIDLKDHFAREATDDIESVFLISKSNCAFVNYKSEASCAAAMARFHDSRFQGVRLVCRLRRGSSSTGTSSQGVTQQPSTSTEAGTEVDGVSKETTVADGTMTAEPEPMEKVKERFFVVKSLTIDDLERSVVSGIWATQAHNEAVLNNAYRTAENVYLVFSANKSGEYFGYARMESAIDDEAAANIEYPPRPEAREPSPADLPLTIPTPATVTAPKGRIIDDSARGTIFWEADTEGKEKEEQQPDDDTGNVSGEGYESTSPATPQTFGKPFKIKWMSTDRLPFYRTRGLRNSLNANREVKIARDGTEIEPTVGRKLVNMFHRPLVPSASPGATRPPQPHQGPLGGFMYGRSY
ncbi:RNA recognition motif aka RRM, RBD, or RNP domain-containing protein isoform 1 [Cladophialophora immunda]|nr:RNA recognition motif aka RRM, RBD, or RNP domain-containing protein isoform 1 [Cladophialophora immunda]